MRYECLVLMLALFGLAQAEDTEAVILATRRSGTVEVFRADSLESNGHIQFGRMAESIEASPDGRKLIIEGAAAAEPNACCDLFALDLETRKMNRLTGGMHAVFSPDGSELYVAWSGIGIVNMSTLERKDRIYELAGDTLYPSPDGHWLFGLVHWPHAALDVFDLREHKLLRRLPVNAGAGLWLGNRFYLCGQLGSVRTLWNVTPDMTELGHGTPVLIAGDGGGHALLAAGQRLLLHEVFGGKMDRRSKTEVIGGAYAIDPSTGVVLQQIEPLAHFSTLIASRDGRELYGLDVPYNHWTDSTRLLKINLESGTLVAERPLQPDVWHFTLAALPKSLVPRGEVQLNPPAR